GSSVLHWDGKTWAFVDSGTPNRLDAIWGSAANDVWAAGNGTIVHWDGVRWSPSFQPPYLLDVTSIAGSGPNDVWVTSSLAGDNGAHWDGHTWTPQRVEGFTLWSAGPDDLWAVGND